MMSKINYDNFYIFCVSIGIILIVSPLIFLIFINYNNLPIIAKNEYDLLNEKSKILFDKIQNSQICLMNHYEVLSIIVFMLGILFFIYGIVNWYKKQKKMIDRIENINLLKQGIELKQMSNDDVKKKIKNEDKKLKHNTKSEFYKIKKFESSFYEFLQKNNNKTFLKNIKITNYAYDIIEISNYGKDKVYEIKHWYKTPAISSLGNLNKVLSKMRNDYYEVRKKEIEIILVINSLGKGDFDYKTIQYYLTEVKYIYVYDNDINNIIAEINCTSNLQ